MTSERNSSRVFGIPFDYQPFGDPMKKLIRGFVYLSADDVTRFTNQPKRCSFLDLYELTMNSLTPGYGRYAVEIKTNLNQHKNINDPTFELKVGFERIHIKSNFYANRVLVALESEVYTHLYNKRHKCLEPNMVFEFTKDTVKVHKHLTQTEYDTLLEL